MLVESEEEALQQLRRAAAGMRDEREPRQRPCEPAEEDRRPDDEYSGKRRRLKCPLEGERRLVAQAAQRNDDSCF